MKRTHQPAAKRDTTNAQKRRRTQTRLWFRAAFWLWGLCFIVCHGCFFEAPNLRHWNCVQAEDCLGDLRCHQGKCLLPCGTTRDCKDAEECVEGFCKKGGDGGLTCIPSPEQCNGKDDDCDGQTDEGITCVAEGKNCDPFAPRPILCQRDLACASFFPERPRTCLRQCDVNKANACGDQRFQCLKDPSNQSVCLQTQCSTQQSDCKYTGQVCVALSSQNRFCLSVHPEGTRKFGEVCSPSAEGTVAGRYCEKSTRCMRESKSSEGFCSIRCTSDTDCTARSSKWKTACLPLQGSIRACLLLCPAGQPDCPEGMICNTANKTCQNKQ